MGQLLVRKVDENLKARLRERARQRGVSMEEEVRTILQNAVSGDSGEEFGLGTRIASLFRDIDWGEEELEPLPRSEVRPATFD